ncbi:F-actin capping protein, beta subunit [Metschnikowia bicuspidata var. bicuspidata NRRL YB-4993]|uniref:F-actin-capping protein subunit beta n=1 Tax=Metschnikowia bicuspidata var. bicuspidata NRRL YB-4993 TaxID=869754 RepID=A0A1A0HJH5_9ASCO|nr:F-actin capping protein, beta subunit [Metschnikowia bicuspidata var. bicuspidata NRRL YB-4993]OBA24165.1 F-actin capping protein, beta subunit [Metschnikowia bicuspidata var. bicuspidata NRRL YB-4993]
MADKFDASLDLLRRLDPKRVSENLNSICSLVQLDGSDEGVELAQDLLAAVDTPLQIARCPDTNKQFLCCDYNRDGDLYRSPFSNQYVPPTDDDELPYPSALLRQLEIKANESFDVYRDLYYEGGGLASVYMWDTAEDLEANSIEEGFAGVVLFKKETEDRSGKWDSVHVFEVVPESSTQATYKVTSSVILDVQKDQAAQGHRPFSLSGTMTRQLQTTQSLSTDGGSLEWAHLVNLGQLVEKSETNVRNLLQDVYFDKLKDIFLKDLRSLGDVSERRAEDIKQKELIKGLQGL